MKDDLLLEDASFFSTPELNVFDGELLAEFAAPTRSLAKIGYAQEVLKILYPNSPLNVSWRYENNTKRLTEQFQEDNSLSRRGLSAETLRAMRRSLLNVNPTGLRPDLIQATEGSPISFQVGTKTLAAFDPDRVAKCAVYLLSQMVGFGFADQPPGRRKAYVDILFWGVGEEINRQAYGRACTLKQSSCALVVRSLWLLLGARDPLLDPPHEPDVMAKVVSFARKAGAWKPVKNLDHLRSLDPQVGDSMYMPATGGKPQHIATIVHIENKIDACVYQTIDGGQAVRSGDKPCCSIATVNRIAKKRSKTFAGDIRPVIALISLEQLRQTFNTPYIILKKQ